MSRYNGVSDYCEFLTQVDMIEYEFREVQGNKVDMSEFVCMSCEKIDQRLAFVLEILEGQSTSTYKASSVQAAPV